MADTEFAVHELGESISMAVLSAQHELEKYRGGAGIFILDEVELKIPVVMRMDTLGQMRVRIVDSQPAGDQSGFIRFHLRPLEEPVSLPAPDTDYPLSTLG